MEKETYLMLKDMFDESYKELDLQRKMIRQEKIRLKAERYVSSLMSVTPWALYHGMCSGIHGFYSGIKGVSRGLGWLGKKSVSYVSSSASNLSDVVKTLYGSFRKN